MPLTPERRRVLRAEKAFKDRNYGFKPRTPRFKTRVLLEDAYRDAISREREHLALIARLRHNWRNTMDALNRKSDRVRYLESKLTDLNKHAGETDGRSNGSVSAAD